jgi:hypothetical protein
MLACAAQLHTSDCCWSFATQYKEILLLASWTCMLTDAGTSAAAAQHMHVLDTQTYMYI